MNKNKSLFLDFIYFKIFHKNADIYFKNEDKINDPYIRDCIKRDTLCRLARALGCKPEELYIFD